MKMTQYDVTMRGIGREFVMWEMMRCCVVLLFSCESSDSGNAGISL